MMAGTTLSRAAFFKPVRRLPRSWAAATALLLLGACAETPSRPVAASPQERELFAEANQDIVEFHIKPVESDEIAIDGLKRLSALDPQLSIARADGQVLVRRGGEVKRFDAPQNSAAAAWGALSAEAIAAARSFSPSIAAIAPDELDETVIDASLAALDPYSRYVRPEVARERRAVRDGFAGIGVTLDIQEPDVRIASVMPDTPAATAGLQAGDRIVALDGVPVAQFGADDLRQHLRGPARTIVQLAIARDGRAQQMDVRIERANIVPESVTLNEAGGIAWLKLRAFNQQTAQSVARFLRQAHDDLGSGLRGIVLDLRGNPGGLLDQSVDVVSLFLGAGDVISTVGRNPESMQHFTVAESSHSEALPMAVLVDGGSASASEIVAAALQDSGRAVVIGTSSYGKGTVQTVLRTSNDGELTVTWAQIITPLGYLLNTHGVVPTLCTSQLDDNPDSAAALFTDASNPVPRALSRPRRALDDAAWHDLRALCPPQHGDRSIDGVVARRLLGNQQLYRRVLASMSSAQVAANP